MKALRHPRAFTLLELLLSLVLLASVAVAATAWAGHVGRACREAEARARWLASAEALLDSMHGDLVLGDQPKRVEAGSGWLRVEARTASDRHVRTIERVYRMEGEALVIAESVPEGVGRAGEVPALDAAATFSVQFDDATKIVSIEVTGLHGERVHRRIRLPGDPR